MKNNKELDSIFLGSIMFTLFFSVIGIFDLLTKKNVYWVCFIIALVSFLLFTYLLKKSKNNTSERFSDERKKLISCRSKGTSFDILLGLIAVLSFLVSSKKVSLSSTSILLILCFSVLIIQLCNYFIYRSKY